MRPFLVTALFMLVAGAAAAQTPATSQRGLVFHVGAARGATPSVSLGMVQASDATPQLHQRREMQTDCTWAPAPDIDVEVEAIVPLRDPASLGGAAQFGDYYAQLFSALVTANGATPAPTQYACVRRTMTALAEGLLRRRAAAAASGAPATSTAPVAPQR